MTATELEADNAKLREQVEQLRTQLADATESVGHVEERCAKTFEVGKRWMAKAARFEAENAKLREQVDAAHMSRLLTENENESLRELLQRLLVEYRYLRVRPRKMYLQHEARMRAIEEEMRELGIEVDA